MELKYALLEKKYEKNESNYLRFGTCSMQGWRARMEDSYINEINIGKKNNIIYLEYLMVIEEKKPLNLLKTIL